MARAIRLNKSHRNTLGLLTGLASADWLKLLVALQSSAELFISYARLRGLFEELGYNPDAVSGVMLLNSIAESYETTVPEILPDVVLELRPENGDLAEMLEDVNTALSDFTEDRKFKAVVAAYRASRRHSNVLDEWEIALETRPVFLGSGADTDFVGLSAYFVIKIKYTDSSGAKAFEIAVDAEDIKDLSTMVGATNFEYRSVKSALESSSPVPITLLGEE